LWEGTGATFGIGSGSESFRCRSCFRRASVVYECGGCTLFVQDESPATTVFDKLVAGLNVYIDGALRPTWRAKTEEREFFAAREFNAWRAEVFYPKFPEERDWPKTKLFSGLTKEAQEFYDSVVGSDRIKYGYHLPVPSRIASPVYPPGRLPAGWLVWYRGDNRWWPVDPAYAVALPIPKDPILVHNEDFFAAVRVIVEVRLSVVVAGMPMLPMNHQPFTPFREVPPEYLGNIAPWYAFEIGEVRFTVGRRKRVVEVRACWPRAVNVDAVAALGDVDKVTHGAIHGGYHIHAWTKGKVIEYIVAMARCPIVPR
jgi:hypothetical protein